jgi:hypothetical protein
MDVVWMPYINFRFFTEIRLIHPEITLEMGEDLALFVVCQGTIQSCIADMEKKLSDPTPEVVVLLPPPIFDSTGE